MQRCWGPVSLLQTILFATHRPNEPILYQHRANRGDSENNKDCLFMPSPSTSSGQALSKYKPHFFSTLLEEHNMNTKQTAHPTFIGIGGMKCATTWLSECLRYHPEIFMSAPKAIFFFGSASNWDKGVDWYLEYFRGGEG